MVFIPQDPGPRTPERPDDPQDVHDYIADCLAHGSTAGEIEKHLVICGYEPAEAAALVGQHVGPEEAAQLSQAPTSKKRRPRRGNEQARLEKELREAVREAGRKNMIYGALWCIGGLLVTGLSCAAAGAGGGGSFIIAWGAVVFGAIQFVRGANQANS